MLYPPVFRSVGPNRLEAGPACSGLGSLLVNQVMKKNQALLAILLIFGLSSCTLQSYFQHPMYAQSQTYKALPHLSDSIRAATYVGGTAYGALTNGDLLDDITGFTGTLHRGHRFGALQAFYGINGTVGKYRVGTASDENYWNSNPNRNGRLIDSLSGDKFIGSWGFTGGLNLVVPLGPDWEWRALGLEYNFQQEWSNGYYDFRKVLQPEDVKLVDQHRSLSTLGFTTEFTGGKQTKFGYKVYLGFPLRRYRLFDYYPDEPTFAFPIMLTQTFMLGSDRISAFGQFTTAYHTIGLALGVNYRLR